MSIMGKYCNHNASDVNNTLITTYGMGRKTAIKVEDGTPIETFPPKVTVRCKFCTWKGEA